MVDGPSRPTDYPRQQELLAKAFDLAHTPPIADFLAEHGFHNFNELPRGAVVGECDLTRIITTEEASDLITEDEAKAGDFSINRYAWRLENPTAYGRPIPAVGQLGLWELLDGEPVQVGL